MVLVRSLQEQIHQHQIWELALNSLNALLLIQIRQHATVGQIPAISIQQPQTELQLHLVLHILVPQKH